MNAVFTTSVSPLLLLIEDLLPMFRMKPSEVLGLEGVEGETSEAALVNL